MCSATRGSISCTYVTEASENAGESRHRGESEQGRLCSGDKEFRSVDDVRGKAASDMVKAFRNIKKKAYSYTPWTGDFG